MTELIATGIVAAMTILSGSVGTGTVSLQQLPVSCIQATDECSNMCNRAPGQDSWACTKMACVTKKDAVCLATTNDKKTSEVSTMCTMQYEPVCAEKQVQCVKAPCDPIKQTYGNSCMAAADQATVISQGECESSSTIGTPDSCWIRDIQEKKCELALVVGNDKDEHGCIGSAGYVWSKDTQQCVRPWEEMTLAGIVSLWAYDTVGITKYSSLEEFRPKEYVTREQAAKMIMGTIDAIGVEEWMIKQPEGSCVWTDTDMIDSSLLPMVTKSCMKGLFRGSNGTFMPKTYLTDTDAMAVMTRAAQYIPALADVMMRSKFAVTDKPLTRGELVTTLHNIAMSYQFTKPTKPIQPQVDLTQAQKDLDAARTLWNAKKMTTYSLVQTRSCFCMEDYTRAMMYHIVDGMINTGSLVYADDGNKVTIETKLNTINQAFDMIQEAIDSKVANLAVQYDAITGYPTSIAIDRDVMIADEEMYYSYKLITDTGVVLSGSYVLDTYNGIKVGNNVITLSFTADRVSAKMCNTMGATYQANKNTLSFGPMMSTEMYCNDTQLMDLESKFGVLSSVSYVMASTNLTMTSSGNVLVWIKK